MTAGSDNLVVPEADLLRAAADWLAIRQLDAPGLRQVARQRSLDFATALLYQALRQSPRHGPLIARLDQPAQQTPALDAEIVVVPGAFYKEKLETGAAGQIIKESARLLKCATVTVPLHSFGTVAENAALLADWLSQRPEAPIILVSHSKGTTEIRRLLARPDAADLFRPIRAWIDLSGLFLGTPIIGWLRRHRLNWWLVRLLFWWKGYAISALDEIDRDACPPWPGALDAAPHLDVIHVIGFPLQRHLSTPLMRRGHRRLSPLGPNDGTILLEDVFHLPGRVYPVWGADHYLRPAGRDMSQLLAGILKCLADSATVARAEVLV
jgi:hypothetical protein